jgi:serine protease Do
MKKAVGTFLLAAVGAAAGFGVMRHFEPAPTQLFTNVTAPAAMQVAQPLAPAPNYASTVQVPDFVQASATATPAVVHIKSFYKQQEGGSFHGFLNPFGGDGGFQPQSSGSGVIISKDGFIATNNHVVKNAEKVMVTLEDKRSFTATVVGTDPTTDLALLKIDQDNLAFLPFANSNEVQVGEWVLAVGNPFNLTSTVTAGIVSAKGRSLNLLNEEFAIESFIQTDAAVNPGNSGGALINTNGQLIGINTAIASETGSYAGYSFAIPVNIVRKVMQDLQEFGFVQRGIIGVQIRDINADLAEDKGLVTMQGAYVTGTIPGGAAEAAGLKPGDIIASVGEAPIKSYTELQEMIGTFRPGDKVQLKVIRDGEPMTVDVTLRSREGKTTLAEKAPVKPEPVKEEIAEGRTSSKLGAQLEPLTFKDKHDLGLDNGVKVVKLSAGKLQAAGIEEGFVITRVNKKVVDSPKQVEDLLKHSEGGNLVEGITAAGKRRYFAFD